MRKKTLVKDLHRGSQRNGSVEHLLQRCDEKLSVLSQNLTSFRNMGKLFFSVSRANSSITEKNTVS